MTEATTQPMTPDGKYYICDGCGLPVEDTIIHDRSHWPQYESQSPHNGYPLYVLDRKETPARSHTACVLAAMEAAGWKEYTGPVGYDYRKDVRDESKLLGPLQARPGDPCRHCEQPVETPWNGSYAEHGECRRAALEAMRSPATVGYVCDDCGGPADPTIQPCDECGHRLCQSCNWKHDWRHVV